MKKITTILLLFLSLIFSCERDDLCPEDTPTTPKLFVEFRDNTLTDNAKNVALLRVEDFDDSERVLEGYNAVTASQMLLPLKTNTTETKYRVYRDYSIVNDEIEGNADVITITYETEEIYVSRACSYKTIYKNVVLTIEDPEPGEENWMQFAEPENENQTVINEDEIHYTIRH
ncbi:DUF6452 family protein [Lacinutrix venerupis]|uniref:Uncharacterized protein n=1 Tax=Lacinutrix venerupis TaxID=1486034 RepID=A0AAC9LMR2_9FLAO|nr:DUF6452 family protein [Lacinutrix venerupis]APY00177.1 hypothetical protein BWR22_07570 [Lacinutrix venerupis]